MAAATALAHRCTPSPRPAVAAVAVTPARAARIASGLTAEQIGRNIGVSAETVRAADRLGGRVNVQLAIAIAGQIERAGIPCPVRLYLQNGNSKTTGNRGRRNRSSRTSVRRSTQTNAPAPE